MSVALLGEWDRWMEANGLSDRTREMYGYAMLRLMRRYPGREATTLTESEVIGFLASLRARGTAKQLYAKGIKGFYTWAEVRGLLPGPSPTRDLHPKRPPRGEPEPLTQAELAALVAAASNVSERRGQAILACYGLGTRRGEFCAIEPADIDWERNRVLLRVTKGGVPRKVAMGPTAREALARLLELPRPRGCPSSRTVVGVGKQTFTMWVHAAAMQAGIPLGKKARAHALRATLISKLDHERVPIAVIRKQSGHRDLASLTYYIGCDEPELDEAMAAV